MKKSESITQQLIPIGKTYDLLKAIPISQQIVKFGRHEVENQVSASIMKCATGLGIQLSGVESKILIEDIIDKYKFDSIEDVQQCLKNGRRGNYGPTYNKLNMIIISDWMAKHLEEKAIARERKLEKIKKEGLVQMAIDADIIHELVEIDSDIIQEKTKLIKADSEKLKAETDKAIENFQKWRKELEKNEFNEDEFQEFKKEFQMNQRKKDPGYLVETKDGKTGRTYNSKEMVNRKIPVYICTKFNEKHPTVPEEFETTGILCDPKNLKQIGFID